ncbi:MAG: TonB-dependent receptor [Sphingobium sp.]
MRRACCLALTTFLCSPALAQGEADPITSIVVTGRGLALPPGTPAYGSTIITRERLTSVASGRLESVLADVAGFQQFRRSDSRSSNPSAQGATLRALGGNASSRTLVLLDGVPMADPFFGYIPFSAIVPDRLAGVRVTRGGGVGAFGAGAVAGTIELESAVRADLPAASGSAAYGSRDSSELSASFTPDLGKGYVSISGRWDRGDGFYTTPRNQRTIADVPARYDGWSTNVRAVAPIGDDMEIQARALIFDDDRTLRFAGASSHSEGQDASIRLVARGAWQVDALAYVQARNFSNVVISSTSFRKTLDQRNTPSTGIGGKIEVRPPVGADNLLRVGVDTRIDSGDMFEDAYNASSGLVTARRHAFGRQSTTGLFVENDWTLGKLILTGGARADRWTITDGQFEVRSASGTLTSDTPYPDRDGWKFSGRAGALLRASDVIALRAAGYTGFRLPTLNELYRPFAVFPVTTQANAALGMEKLKGVEVGADLTPLHGMTFAATAFYNRLGNAVANVTIGTNLRQRQNVDAIVAKGIELTASAQYENWSLLASYAYSHAEVKAPDKPFDGLIPAQSPRHAAAATFSWEPVKGASLSTTVRYVSRQYEDDLQTDALPAAVTLDGFARFPITPRLAVIGRAENIFDKAVVTRNAGGSIDLGTPRTLWIGIRFEG